MSDRKYKQQGYQDGGGSGRDQGGLSSPREPRDPTLKPGGRGLGKPTATTFRCKVCGTENPIKDFAQDTVCGHCGADLHTCTHCAYFDTAAVNQCREPRAEPVRAKAKRNECDYFKPRRAKEFAKSESPGGGSTRDAKAAFDSLFNF